MIKLTQINTTTVSITRNETDGPVVDKQYIFKFLWINPAYVTKVEEDAAINNENIKKT